MDKGGRTVYDSNHCVNCGKCVERCYARAIKLVGGEMTVEEVICEADKDMVFYKQSGGGVTFSGGEPLLFPDFVEKVARHYKERQVSTAIETCGYVEWKCFEKILPVIDHILFDVKMINDKKHRQYTGVSNARILENLKKATALGHTVVRTPIIPSVNDSQKDIEEFGQFLESLNHCVDTVHILPYHNMGSNKYKALGRKYELEELVVPSDEKMHQIKSLLETHVKNVIIGG